MIDSAQMYIAKLKAEELKYTRLSITQQLL